MLDPRGDSGRLFFDVSELVLLGMERVHAMSKRFDIAAPSDRLHMNLGQLPVQYKRAETFLRKHQTSRSFSLGSPMALAMLNGNQRFDHFLLLSHRSYNY